MDGVGVKPIWKKYPELIWHIYAIRAWGKFSIHGQSRTKRQNIYYYCTLTLMHTLKKTTTTTFQFYF